MKSKVSSKDSFLHSITEEYKRIGSIISLQLGSPLSKVPGTRGSPAQPTTHNRLHTNRLYTNRLHVDQLPITDYIQPTTHNRLPAHTADYTPTDYTLTT